MTKADAKPTDSAAPQLAWALSGFWLTSAQPATPASGISTPTGAPLSVRSVASSAASSVGDGVSTEERNSQKFNVFLQQWSDLHPRMTTEDFIKKFIVMKPFKADVKFAVTYQELDKFNNQLIDTVDTPKSMKMPKHCSVKVGRCTNNASWQRQRVATRSRASLQSRLDR